MKVLFATAELSPVARVGGLAEASAGLVNAVRASGVEVDVVIPDYGGVELGDQRVEVLDVPAWAGPCTVRSGSHNVAGAIRLVEVPGMARPHPYVDERGQGWADNDRRFMAFSAAVAALARSVRPDIVHLNDWHPAAAVGLMVDVGSTVLTIHTLGYQGIAGPHWLDRLTFNTDSFRWFGETNPLAGAIDLADRIIAVSPNYAAEIVRPENGMGLSERLADRRSDLVGIRNGIDATVWNPAGDTHLPVRYSAAAMDGREANRVALRSRAGWPIDTKPVIGVVSRLVEQKGIDLLLETVRFLPTLAARLFVLGAGDAELAAGLRAAADADPDHVWFHDGYDVDLAHLIFAGSDLFAMPSRFEPCGLAQMQAMAYGSIPLVTEVGGLLDTVIDADRDRNRGTGFTTDVDVPGLVDGLHRAIRGWRHLGRRRAIQRRGMETDWSWATPAARHIELYQQLKSTQG